MNISQREAKRILLYNERKPCWIEKMLYEVYTPKNNFTLAKIELTEEEFRKLIYNTDAYRNMQVKDVIYQPRKIDEEILKLKENISENGYDYKSHLLLRCLYLPNDPKGSYYIDNGLHRSFALALLFSEGRKYFPVPAVVGLKQTDTGT